MKIVSHSAMATNPRMIPASGHAGAALAAL